MCNSKRLCKQDSCILRFKKSFASHYRCRQWDYLKNGKIKPIHVFKSSKFKAWFICECCNHSFEINLNNVNNGQWCPYCNSNMLCEDECDFCFNRSYASVERARIWHKTKNDKTPRQTSKYSNKKAWFTCDVCFHDYQVSISSSVNHGCSFCYKRIMCKTPCEICFENSFGSVERSKFLTKNNNFNPNYIFKNDKRKAEFCCPECNHKFKTSILSVSQGSWCPYCINKNEMECKRIIEMLTGFQFDKRKYNWLNGYELDGFCEELNLAFEYNGKQHYIFVPEFFHKYGFHIFLEQQLRDEIKKRICKQMNINLIIIPFWIKDKETFIKNELKNYCDIII